MARLDSLADITIERRNILRLDVRMIDQNVGHEVEWIYERQTCLWLSPPRSTKGLFAFFRDFGQDNVLLSFECLLDEVSNLQRQRNFFLGRQPLAILRSLVGSLQALIFSLSEV
jgi:hypothetical protein